MRQSVPLRLLTMTITFLLLSAGAPGGNTPTAAAPLRGGGSQFLSIAGTSFVSADSANSYTYQPGGGVKLLSAPTPWPFMSAPVELPDGATIDSVTLYYFDTDATASIILYLMRTNGAGAATYVASLSSADDGTNYKTVTISTNGEVDNVGYNYMLMAEVDSANLILYGARIAYSPPLWSAAAPAGEQPMAPAAQPALPAPAAAPATAAGHDPGAETARYAGGQVIPLPAPSTGVGRADRAASTQETASSLAPGIAAGLNPLAVGNPAHWQRYAVPASTFHLTDSGASHYWVGGGGRCVTAGTGLFLEAPLDLIDGKTIRQVRFIYYDHSSSTNPTLIMYRADRQGSTYLLWYYTPIAFGDYFTAISPPMNEVVDNANWAYYFEVALGSPPAGTDLCAMKVEVDYVADTYLPIILMNH